MKPGIHPAHGPVVHRDTPPLVDVEGRPAGHAFATGAARVLDAAGRVERFERRCGDRR
ncbi:50S ribosomal protein L31 [Streptomyces sp. NPDC051921]|uniref:50S ribosomal protein L31 n=1 Tax=Streptomyces sp. NPDC051921 TaxID=3155806 RepID=UPI00343A0A0D